MYVGNFISLEFMPFSHQKEIDELNEKSHKIALMTLEINGTYVTFNVYKQLSELFPKLNNKLVLRLERLLEGEKFSLDDALHFMNFDEIIQKHII